MHTLIYRKPKLILILIIAFLFCTSVIIFERTALRQNEESFIKSFKNQQELLVSQVANQANNMISKKSGTEQDVIERIIKTAETSGNRYWFFVKNKKILFFKNDNETAQLKNNDIDKILDSYKNADGENIDALITLFNQRKSGSVLFSESKKKEPKLASISFFKVNGTAYSIGMCTTENFILDNGEISKHNFYSLIALVAICLFLFTSVVLIIIIINNKNEDILILKKMIQSKNLEIEKITTVSSEPDALYDEKTNIYGKKVLDSLLKKINNPKLFPISTIVINIHNSKNITYDGLISELSTILQKLLPPKNVITRTKENQLTVLLFNTNLKSAKDLQTKLIKSWSGILHKLHTSVETDVITHLFENDIHIDNFEYLTTARDKRRERI